MGLVDKLITFILRQKPKEAKSKKRDIPYQDMYKLRAMQELIIQNGRVDPKALANYERAVEGLEMDGCDTTVPRTYVIPHYRQILAKQSSANTRA